MPPSDARAALRKKLRDMRQTRSGQAPPATAAAEAALFGAAGDDADALRLMQAVLKDPRAAVTEMAGAVAEAGADAGPAAPPPPAASVALEEDEAPPVIPSGPWCDPKKN